MKLYFKTRKECRIAAKQYGVKAQDESQGGKYLSMYSKRWFIEVDKEFMKIVAPVAPKREVLSLSKSNDVKVTAPVVKVTAPVVKKEPVTIRVKRSIKKLFGG